MEKSEYDYAQIGCTAWDLGRFVAFWAEEGWDVVTASFPGDDTHCARALLRRKRGSELPPPGFRQDHGNVHLQRDDDGSWRAHRNGPKNDGVVAGVQGYTTPKGALEALAALALDTNELGLVNAGQPQKAMTTVAARLRMSRYDAVKLVQEIDPDYGDRW